MNSNENTRPATSARASGRSARPRALRRPIDPVRLEQLICQEGVSLTRAARLMGVCKTTVSIAVVRFGIATSARLKKVDHALNQQVFHALERNVPLAQVCAETGLSLASMYEFLRMYPQQARAYKQRVLEQERLAKRQRFIEQTASMTMTACPDYYWLRRNDQEWLAMFSGKRSKRSS